MFWGSKVKIEALEFKERLFHFNGNSCVCHFFFPLPRFLITEPYQSHREHFLSTKILMKSSLLCNHIGLEVCHAYGKTIISTSGVRLSKDDRIKPLLNDGTKKDFSQCKTQFL